MSNQRALKICLILNVLINSRFTENYNSYGIAYDYSYEFMELFFIYFKAFYNNSSPNKFKPIFDKNSYSYNDLKILNSIYREKLTAYFKHYNISMNLLYHNTYINHIELTYIERLSKEQRINYLHNKGWLANDKKPQCNKADRHRAEDVLETQGYNHQVINRSTVLSTVPLEDLEFWDVLDYKGKQKRL